MLTHLMKKREDDGLTLVELLVAMVIIGVLAAIAIPVFLNQQRTSRDAVVTSDVRNAAHEIQALLVSNPYPTSFSISPRTINRATITIDGYTTDVILSTGVALAVRSGDIPGDYKIYGWNSSGKTYAQQALLYDSAKGGMQATPVPIPTGSNSGDGEGGLPGQEPPESEETTPEPVSGLQGSFVSNGTSKYAQVSWVNPTQGSAITSIKYTFKSYDSTGKELSSYAGSLHKLATSYKSGTMSLNVPRAVINIETCNATGCTSQTKTIR